LDDRSKDDAAIISLEGRMYPIEIAYLEEPTRNYVASAVDAVLAINSNVSIQK
jgi:ATP-dependent RNA helicase DDX35